MNTKALVAVIAFVAAASAMAQFKSNEAHEASASLRVSSLSSVVADASSSGFGFDSTGRAKVRLGTMSDASLSAHSGSSGMGVLSASPVVSERLSLPEPGNYAMLLAGLGVIGFIAGRRQQG